MPDNAALTGRGLPLPAGNLVEVGLLHTLGPVKQSTPEIFWVQRAQFFVRERLQLAPPLSFGHSVEDLPLDHTVGVRAAFSRNHNGSPQRSNAMPPMMQNFHCRAVRKACRSRAASNTGVIGAGPPPALWQTMPAARPNRRSRAEAVGRWGHRRFRRFAGLPLACRRIRFRGAASCRVPGQRAAKCPPNGAGVQVPSLRADPTCSTPAYQNGPAHRGMPRSVSEWPMIRPEPAGKRPRTPRRDSVDRIHFREMRVSRQLDAGQFFRMARYPPATPTCGRPESGAKVDRSEERRVGKECRSRWSPY